MKKYRKYLSDNYYVHDLDGNLVFKGTVKEVSGELKVCQTNVTNAVKRGYVVGNKYRITYKDECVPSKEKTINDPEVQEVLKMLNCMGEG